VKACVAILVWTLTSILISSVDVNFDANLIATFVVTFILTFVVILIGLPFVFCINDLGLLFCPDLLLLFSHTKQRIPAQRVCPPL
jgi:hypothetical protein